MLRLRRVAGDSMLPMLRPGRFIVVAGRGRTREGDVIVFRHDQLDKLKRVAKVRGRELYVTGDNAQHSTDSRQFGWINQDTVKGKVIWPTNLHQR